MSGINYTVVAALLLLSYCPVVCAQFNSQDVKELPEPAKRFALIIGVEDYSAGITKLDGPANDVREIRRVLETFGGFPSDQIVTLSSDQKRDDMKPNHNQILSKLDRFRAIIPPDGLLLVAFSGHGTETKDNHEPFLLPADADMGSDVLIRGTSISLNNLRDAIKLIGVKQVVILLDMCRESPEASKGLQDNKMTSAYRMSGPDWDTRNTGIEAFAVLYATDEGKRSYIAKSVHQGYFSMAFVDGISGQAKNSKDEVTLGGLVKYLQEQVPKLVLTDLGKPDLQKPIADIRGYRADDLVIAQIPVVNTGLKYVLDVHVRPVIVPQVSVQVPVANMSVGASAITGEDQKWEDQVFDGGHLITTFQYPADKLRAATPASWNYEIVVLHVQTPELVRTRLSDKEPAARGIRTAISSDGRLLIDVTQAAEGWR